VVSFLCLQALTSMCVCVCVWGGGGNSKVNYVRSAYASSLSDMQLKSIYKLLLK
jgi:hypothetical protein